MPGDGEMTWRSLWTPLLLNGLAPWDGVEKAPTYLYLFLYIFYSYYPLVPGRDLAPVLFSPQGSP